MLKSGDEPGQAAESATDMALQAVEEAPVPQPMKMSTNVGAMICSGPAIDVTVIGSDFEVTYPAYGFEDQDGVIVFYVPEDSPKVKLRFLRPYQVKVHGRRRSVRGGPTIQRKEWNCSEIILLPGDPDDEEESVVGYTLPPA